MIPIDKFRIYRDNNYLYQTVRAYYSYDYYSKNSEYYDEANTGFINILKNDLNKLSERFLLKGAKERARMIVQEIIPFIMQEEGLDECVCISVPRSKKYSTYFPNQLYMIDAISEANQSIENVEDGARVIIRHSNTRTNHLPEDMGRATVARPIYKGEGANDGPLPYPGITKDTCNIDKSKIFGKAVVLIDDIYTPECYVDEDCIQAMYDMGASRVIFYAFGKTKKGVW